jgi:adenine phosphoribosyltransferase
MFRDITTLLKDAAGFHATIETLAARYRDRRIAKVAGIEARGFIVAAPLAFTLGAGFVPLRKHGRLPAATVGHDYALEYGTDRIEMHVDAIAPGERVLVADDLIATGGTAAAAVKLIEGAGGEVVECCFVIELSELGGRRRIEALGHRLFALCEFAGE